jgi:hypothetical protein
MKALSVMQPWASLIVGGPLAPGVKRTENRGRNMAGFARSLVGQRIAIHASKKRDMEAFRDLADGTFGFGLKRDELPHATIAAFPTGAIVGAATLGRVFGPGEQLTEDEARFYVGNDLLQDGETFGLSFGDRRWIEPIRDVKGALGFWRVSDEREHEREIEARLARRTA